MAIVNSGLSQVILATGPGKDSRWLTLEVCREFARSKCSRTDEECKYAHPPPHVEIQNGRVTCCFDSIKGKCHRKDPPCKYLHPPQHLKEILLQNGRQNLILKNLQMQAAIQPAMLPMHGMYPVVYEQNGNTKPIVQAPYSNMIIPGGHYLTMVPQGAGAHPYLISNPAAGYSYFNPTIAGYSTLLPAYDTSNTSAISVNMAGNQLSTATLQSAAITNGTMQTLVDQQNCAKESLSAAPSSSATMRSPSMSSWDGSSSPTTQLVAIDSTTSPYCQPIYYKGMNGVPSMVPVMKRPALVDAKSGLPVYRQFTAAAYPQAALAPMQMQQFVPMTIAGPTTLIPRY